MQSQDLELIEQTAASHRNWNVHQSLDRGEGVVSNWFREKRMKGLVAKLDSALDHLVAQPKYEWDRPHASPLGHGAYVVRFKGKSREQYRVFGYFEDSHHCFVMVLTGQEKDDQYHPSNYEQKIADERSDISEDFDGKTSAYEGRCDYSECAVSKADDGQVSCGSSGQINSKIETQVAGR